MPTKAKKVPPQEFVLQDDFDSTPIPFGKHQGLAVSKVKLSYLDYILGEWETDGKYKPHVRHDEFMFNLQAYMKQEWVQSELEKELEEPGEESDEE